MNQTADTPIVSLQHVALSLPGPHGAVAILRDITLSIAKGESVSIMGPSGSGKTSLMMLMAGIMAPSKGTVQVAGEDITHASEEALAAFRREQVGIVFQDFHLIETMTALENVALGPEFAGVKDARNKAMDALKEVGLEARKDHFPAQLSGGEQQRVAIARAMVSTPALLLADEPTGNLDSKTGQQVIELLFQLQEKHGTTLVLITHDEALAARAERSISLADGGIDNA
ncbi:MAG: ABC transporter ATP-binding protein [Rickettsiales bacterium]